MADKNSPRPEAGAEDDLAGVQVGSNNRPVHGRRKAAYWNPSEDDGGGFTIISFEFNLAASELRVGLGGHPAFPDDISVPDLCKEAILIALAAATQSGLGPGETATWMRNVADVFVSAAEETAAIRRRRKH
jgi:hypothetical protein